MVGAQSAGEKASRRTEKMHGSAAPIMVICACKFFLDSSAALHSNAFSPRRDAFSPLTVVGDSVDTRGGGGGG